MINHHYSSVNDIKRNINKFKETNEYIQQKYDFLDQNKSLDNEQERKKIELHLNVFIKLNYDYFFLAKRILRSIIFVIQFK